MPILLVDSVPVLENRRLGRFTERVAAILNSLLRDGVLVQDGPGEWTVDPSRIPGLVQIINSTAGGSSIPTLAPPMQRWLYGSIPPGLELGREGDFYFQAQGGFVWVKETPFFGCPPRWKIVAKLPSAGPQGFPGPQGPQGPPGRAGRDGADTSVDTTAWTPFTPSWTSTGTAPDFGNATLDCAYKSIGKTTFVRYSIVFGNTSTFGTGTWSFSLPVTPKTGPRQMMMAMAQDTGTGSSMGMCFVSSGTTTFNIGTTAGALWTVSSPHTWASTDAIRISGVLETD